MDLMMPLELAQLGAQLAPLASTVFKVVNTVPAAQLRLLTVFNW